MATRTKTIEFAHDHLSGLTDNVLTALTSLEIYIPESGITFRSVVAIMSAGIVATTQGNIVSRRLECRLGAAAYTSNTNANLWTGSSEDPFIFHAVDLTAHFTANWTGTNMTFMSQVLIDGTQSPPTFNNVCVSLMITYDYDDTSATQIKTVRIPLNAPATALATVKPGTATASIPDMDIELPETGKVFRAQFITIQGNIERAGTGDPTLSYNLASGFDVTTGAFEGGANTDYFYRWCSRLSLFQYNPSNASDFFIWASAADFDHPQVWLTITYEFDATASTDCFVSLLIPAGPYQEIGGTTSSDFLRLTSELWVPEDGVTHKSVTFFPFWEQAAAIAGMNMRVGTGAFVAYSSVAATVAGSCAAMIRNDSAFTIAKGKNVLTADAYRTDTADWGSNFSGFWIINYTCSKPAAGYGAANRTIISNNGVVFDGVSAGRWLSAAINMDGFLNWTQKRFISSFGYCALFYPNSTGQYTGMTISAERLSGEPGGRGWIQVASGSAQTDPETGLHMQWNDFTSFFKQWDNSVDNRLDPAQARRWVIAHDSYVVGWLLNQWFMTYHEITKTVADSVSGFSGTVTIGLHLEADTAKFIKDERVLETTRTGDGAFSFTWYDDTEQVYVVASDGTNVGRSTAGTAV